LEFQLYHATVQKKQIIFSCGGGVAVLTRQNLHADQACGLAAYIFYLRACAPLAALRPYIYMCMSWWDWPLKMGSMIPTLHGAASHLFL